MLTVLDIRTRSAPSRAAVVAMVRSEIPKPNDSAVPADTWIFSRFGRLVSDRE